MGSSPISSTFLLHDVCFVCLCACVSVSFCACALCVSCPAVVLSHPNPGALTSPHATVRLSARHCLGHAWLEPPSEQPHATRAGSRGSWLWRRGAGMWAVDSSAQGCILDRAPLPAPCTTGHSEQLAPDRCVMWPVSPRKIAYDMQGQVSTNCSCGLMDKAPPS